MVVSFISIGLNVAVKIGSWHSISSWAFKGYRSAPGLWRPRIFLLLYFLMRKEAKLSSRELLITLAKLVVASAALAVVCWASQTWVLGGWKHWGVMLKIAGLMGTIGVAAVVYFLAALALRIQELDEVTALAKRKLGRFAKRG